MKNIILTLTLLFISNIASAGAFLTEDQQRQQQQQQQQLQNMIDKKQTELGRQQMQEMNVPIGERSRPYIESPSIKTYQELQQLKQLQQ